ncbi:hypothetical protein [Erwinia persicina]|uniref:hypothetical protein n=1 Tax=Erwinia persicina TaxID=55211 RepID=UPI00177DDD47|nr:hypothetical protein [Erwinia persicina]MBD8165596.1 hypothetical protein [Erwinia persicina]
MKYILFACFAAGYSFGFFITFLMAGGLFCAGSGGWHGHWQTGQFVATALGIPLTVLVFLQTRFGGLSDFDQHLAHASTDEESKSISSPQLVRSISWNIVRTCVSISAPFTASSGVKSSSAADCW